MSIHPHPLMGRSRPPGQETQPTRDLLRETPAAAGSGRSKPWRRTNPIPRAAARKLILPRASSASAGTVPRSAPTTTPIHPHPLMDRSRTPGHRRPGLQGTFFGGNLSGSGIGPERALEANTLIPSRKARKLILPRASSASAGLIPRSAPTTPTVTNVGVSGSSASVDTVPRSTPTTKPTHVPKPSVYASKETPKSNTKSTTSGVPTWKTLGQR